MNEQPPMLDQVLAGKRESSKKIVDVDEPADKLVIFQLHDAWFAVHGDKVREILPQMDVFYLPGCPSSLAGVIDVRGDIESVILLYELLRLPEPAGDQRYAILLCRGGGMSSGVRVDRVVDVLDVARSSIHPPPATLPDHLRPIVSGLLRHQEQPVTVLDLERLFADYRLGLG